MRATSRSELALLAPAAVFLFILPFPHTVALRLLCLLAAAAIAIVLWRRLAPPPVPLKIPLVVWAAVLLVSIFFAVDPPYTVRELKNELGYTMIAFAALFVLAGDEARLRWLALAVVACFLVISVSALAGYAWKGSWGSGAFYGGEGTISNYFVTAAPVIALAVWLWNPPRVGWCLALLAGLYLCAGLISGQRALWPGLGAQLLVLCAWLWRAKPQRLVLGIALVAALTAAGLWASEQVRLRADPDSPNTIFRDARPKFWLAVSQKVLEQPLHGAGFGQRALIKAYPELMPGNTHLWHAHNLPLNYGVYAGLPGVAAILFLFAALYWRFWRLALSADRGAQLAGLAGAAMVAGVFARNTFNDFFIRDGALLFWGLAGMLLGYALRRSR